MRVKEMSEAKKYDRSCKEQSVNLALQHILLELSKNGKVFTMFRLFGKNKKLGKSEEERRAELLPRTKKVQFEPMKIPEAEALLDSDIRSVLDFIPVNYYATKNSYMLCAFYYAEDYSEIYMQFEYRVDDICRGKSRLYTVDKTLMRDILRKFGVTINI